MELNELISAYNGAATLVGFYWHFYAVVAFGLVGFVLGGEKSLSTGLRVALLIGFWAFTVASLGALLNKHGLHYAFAHEISNHPNLETFNTEFIKEKLTVCEGILAELLPSSCLHATPPNKTGYFQIAVAALVSVVLMVGRRK